MTAAAGWLRRVPRAASRDDDPESVAPSGADRLPPARRHPWMLVLGAGLGLVGSGLLVVGVSLGPATTVVVGPNVAINAAAADKRDLSANNSPTLAANPTNPANLALANRIDTPLFSCALHVSFDAGASWEETAIPFPGGEEAPPRCFAPDIAFGSDGRLYLSFATLIGMGNSPHAIWMASSTDGGHTLSVPTRVLGPLAFQVRIAADPGHAGRLYLSWLHTDSVGNLSFTHPGNPILVARSDDGGATWSAPVAVNPPSRQMVVAPSLAVGGGGELLCAYLDLGADRLDYEGGHQGQGGAPYDGTWQLVVARSIDGGRTWHEDVVDGRVVPLERFVVFLPVFPSLVVDRRHGRVYVGFHDRRLGDGDVFVWASADGGVHFSRATRVNDTPLHDGTAQYLPQLAVAPDGRLDVIYYDRRADPANQVNEVSLQSSGDGGRSFGPRIRLSDHRFDSRIGFGSQSGLADLGSRLALLSTDRAALAVWPDTRAGRVATQGAGSLDKQDMARAIVAFRPGSPTRAPLVAAGLALAATATMSLVWWALVTPALNRVRRRRASDDPVRVQPEGG